MSYRPLKLWNGRCYSVLPPEWQKGSHAYIAAHSVADIRRLCEEMGLPNWPSAHEVTMYFSPCWGDPMKGVTPARGVFFTRCIDGQTGVYVVKPGPVFAPVEVASPDDPVARAAMYLGSTLAREQCVYLNGNTVRRMASEVLKAASECQPAGASRDTLADTLSQIALSCSDAGTTDRLDALVATLRLKPAGLSQLRIAELIRTYGSNAAPTAANEWTTGDLPLVGAVIQAVIAEAAHAFPTPPLRTER